MNTITVKELIELKKDDADLSQILLKKDCIKGEYSYILTDKDLDKSYIHCSIPEFDYEKEYLFLGDKKYAVLIPVRRSDYNINYDYNSLIVVDSDCLDKCDICGKVSIRDVLVPISPENTEELGDLNEDFEDFEVFMCSDCYESNLSHEYKSKIIY